MIIITEFVIGINVSARNFSFLSKYARVQSLCIDAFNPHFAPLVHKNSPNLLLGCFLNGISEIIVPQEQGLWDRL